MAVALLLEPMPPSFSIISVDKNTSISEQGPALKSIVLITENLPDVATSPIAAPIGANGWRAGGNIYAFVHLSGKWFIRLPNIGLALLIKSDLPNPNQFIAAFKIIGIKFEINSGESCVLAQ